MIATHKNIIATLAATAIATNTYAAISPQGDIKTSFGDPIDIYTTTASSNIAVAFDSQAQLIIDNATNFDAQNIFIAERNTAVGQLIVKDPGTILTTAHSLYIGRQGLGTFTLENGATANTAAAAIAVYPKDANFSGIANIQDPGTNWNMPNGILQVALYGNGQLNISNQAQVLSSNTYLAVQTNSNAELNIQDPTTLHTTTNTLSIGFQGNATLNLSNNAIAQANQVITAQYAPSQAIINITTNAQLDIKNTLLINTNSTLNISPTTTNTPSINVVNTATLNGQLNIITDNIHTLNPQQTIPLINIDGTRIGTFQNHNEGDLIASINQYNLYLTYQAGDGNDVHLTTQTTTQILGDTNNDSQINQADLDNVIQNFGTNSFRGDANHDGQTNLADLFAIRNNFTSPTPIPEPTTLLTLLTITPLLLTRKNR